MAILSIPEESRQIDDPQKIKSYLSKKGVLFDQWQASKPLTVEASQEDVLEAYKTILQPYMAENGYQVADVVNIHAGIENYADIRAKFLAEHTHTEDEVRFFVEGEGLFWFNLEDSPVFNVLCQKGDLISVPKNTKHWFDAGETNPNVKAIRIFIDAAGWVPHYTHSGIEKEFIK